MVDPIVQATKRFPVLHKHFGSPVISGEIKSLFLPHIIHTLIDLKRVFERGALGYKYHSSAALKP